jgi:CheY-like chemotaxis protein
VAVEDTGAGIDPTRLKQLFQPFIQGDATTTRTHGGTGLGLAIAQRLVNLMGGTITVESALGSGSTFRFEVDAPTAPTDATEISPGGLTLKGEHHQLHADVLLVDDNPINLAVAEAMLVRLGCTVTALDNAPEALRTTASHTFDVVLMDCQMPVMDGFEATIALREQGYQQPVIALTAGVTMEERQRCMESGMNAVIAKPATLSSLREALLRWASTETPDDKPAAAPPGDVPPLHP